MPTANAEALLALAARCEGAERPDRVDRDKFKRLVHYVISRAGHKPGFGSTKLNKVLWFAEARAYVLRGRPIAGAKYIREKYGPVPRAIMPTLDELEREGFIERKRVPYFNRETTRFISLVPVDVSDFDKSDLYDVDYWIKNIADNHTAQPISEESHDYAWEIAKMGEELPYYALLSERMREPNEAELDWARKRAVALKLR